MTLCRPVPERLRTMRQAVAAMLEQVRALPDSCAQLRAASPDGPGDVAPERHAHRASLRRSAP